jgi:hypothetical protein
MAAGADHGDMTAVFIIVAALLVLLLSVPFGVDSRRTNVRGHHRPNWL